MDKINLQDIKGKDDREAFDVMDLLRSGQSTEADLYKLSTAIKLMAEKMNEIIENINKIAK